MDIVYGIAIGLCVSVPGTLVSIILSYFISKKTAEQIAAEIAKDQLSELNNL